MKLYRKKPITISAVQYTGNNLNEILTFTRGNAYLNKSNALMIKTLEGEHIASVGDFIIEGIHKEYYPCKPDIFAKTYECV